MLNPFLMDEKMLTEKHKGKERGRYAKDGLSTYLPTYLPTQSEGRWRNRSQPFALYRLIIRVRVSRRRLQHEDEEEARRCKSFGFVALLRSVLRFWESSEELTLLQWGPRYAYFALLLSFFCPDHLCWKWVWWIASRTGGRLVWVYVISSNCVWCCNFAPVDWLPLLSLPWLLFMQWKKKRMRRLKRKRRKMRQRSK